MKIKELPWFDRPWTRLKKKGLSALSDAELLAVVLGRGNMQENAVDLSHRVLKTSNFDKLGGLSLGELEQMLGNDIQAMRISAMFEIYRRTNRLSRRGFSTQVKTPEDVFNHFVDILKDVKKEHFYALLLDTKNRVISEELISVGTLNASLIHPREVFNPAIKQCSHAMVLVHNHPSGDCTPSGEDYQVTKTLTDAGDLLGISVLDHIIIGNEKFYSFKEKG